MKQDIKDIDEVFIRVEKYIRLEGIQKRISSTSAATISVVPVKVQEPQFVDVSRSKQNKKARSKYTF